MDLEYGIIHVNKDVLCKFMHVRAKVSLIHKYDWFITVWCINNI